MGKWAAACVLCLVVLSACATEASPRESLPAITDMQNELARLDERTAALDLSAADASSEANKLLNDYRALAEQGRSERPEGASGPEGDLWDSFLSILDLRVEGAETLVGGLESGDLASMNAEIEAVNERNTLLIERFNRALSHFRSDEPPRD